MDSKAQPPAAATSPEIKRPIHWYSVHRLGPSHLLPAICPECTAPGTRAIAIPSALPGLMESGIEAFYCDICADRLEGSATQNVALVATSGLFTISIVTAMTLALGTRLIGGQVLATLLVSGLVPEILWRVREKIAATPGTLWVHSEPQTQTRAENTALDAPSDRQLICSSKKFASILAEHGIPAFAEERASPRLHYKAIVRRNFSRVRLLLLSVGLAALGLIHSLGGANVRVITSGDDSAILLIDSRHSGRVSPAGTEDPRSGRMVRVLGGRRNLQLISASGRILADQSVTIWPGRTYIVGHLPPNRCLYWEHRTYGTGVDSSSLQPLPGDGPIWSLRKNVDSWFVPLAPQGREPAEKGPDWDSSGGIRRAIRLLPCRPALIH